MEARLKRVDFTHIRRPNPLKVKRVEITRHEKNQQGDTQKHNWRTSAASPSEKQARCESRQLGRATCRARHLSGQIRCFENRKPIPLRDGLRSRRNRPRLESYRRVAVWRGTLNFSRRAALSSP